LRLAEHFAKDNDGDLCQTRIMKFLGVCLSASILGKVSSFAQPLSRASAFGVRAPTRRSDVRRPTLAMSDARYTIPDQPARFAQAVAEKNVRVLDIDAVFDPSSLKGLRVAVTGANRGIGLALSTELVAVGAQVVAIVRSSSPALDALGVAEVITGVDATDDDICGSGMCEQIKGGPIDVVSRHRWRRGVVVAAAVVVSHCALVLSGRTSLHHSRMDLLAHQQCWIFLRARRNSRQPEFSGGTEND